MGWEWFHRWGSPRWFYDKTERWVPWLGGISLVLLVIGASWGLGFTDQEAKQGNSYRIIYIHVPTSGVAMSGYILMAVAGAVGLIWRMKLAFSVLRCAAPIGALLAFASLFTGAIWGKPTWGTWFEWRDPRIASTMLLLFLYMGVIALQSSYQSKDTADRFSAILAIVGVVNIPIIYWSVSFLNSIHQGATFKITGKSTMALEMLYPFLIMMLAFYLFYAYALLKAVRLDILHRESRTRWVQDLVMGAR